MASMQGYLIRGLPIIKEGDDIASLVQSLFDFQDGDVLCLASTIVAKSEGRFRDLESYQPSRTEPQRSPENIGKDPRFVQAVLDESVEVLLDRPFLLVVTRFGHIGVNAGIDQSNVGDDRILLLPEDPSASAQAAAREARKGLRRNHHRYLRPAFSLRRGGRGHRLGRHCRSAGLARGARYARQGPGDHPGGDCGRDRGCGQSAHGRGRRRDSCGGFPGLEVSSLRRRSVFMAEDKDVIRPRLKS